MSAAAGDGARVPRPVAPAREQAVARSLDSARSRAETRVQRYLDAASALIAEKGGIDFTVQEIVERSELSLRSFYQSFEGKQHLLLAVYEEAMVETAAHMRAAVGLDGDVIDRLHTFVTTLFEWSEHDPVEQPPAPHRTVRAMAPFVFEEITNDRRAAFAATGPLFELLVELIAEGQEAGRIRPDSPRRLASLVMQSTMFCAYTTTISGSTDAHRAGAEAMWAFCYGGLHA